MSSGNQIEKEAIFGFLPSMRKDRTYGLLDYTLTQIGFGLAAWCFLIGGWTGTVARASDAIWIILLGNALPVFLMLPLAKHAARRGLDTFLLAVPALGHVGSKIFFVVFAILNLGWITIALFMLGESFIRLVNLTGGPEALQTRTFGAPLFALVFFAFSLFVGFKGPEAIKIFTRWGVAAIMLILVGLIIGVIGKYGFGTVFAAEPTDAFENYHLGVMSGLEWNIGLGFSWLPYIGQWCRLVRSERAAVHGTFLGWGLILNIAAVFGALATLAIGFGDPTDWIVALGGTALGVVGLLMLILANTTSAVILIYTQGLSFKTQFPRWSWGRAVATTIPAALLMLSPSFYDAYGTFLLYVSFIMSIMAGIMVVDYFVRKGRVEVGAIYDRGNPHYRYPLGINPAAIIAAVVGSLAYWLAYNPVSGETGFWFSYLAAGVPSFFVAGFVYWAGMVTVFSRYRKVDNEWCRRVEAGEIDAVMLPPNPLMPRGSESLV